MVHTPASHPTHYVGHEKMFPRAERKFLALKHRRRIPRRPCGGWLGLELDAGLDGALDAGAFKSAFDRKTLSTDGRLSPLSNFATVDWSRLASSANII